MITIKHTRTGKVLLEVNAGSLVNANLVRANLVRANLRGADLVSAYLLGAYLLGADLLGANLQGADLDIHIISLDRIGSEKRKITYNITHDIVWCGCFTGTFAEFNSEIASTYTNEDKHYREYLAAVTYMKAIAKIGE